MKTFTLVLIFTCSLSCFSQDSDLNLKMDSILTEADLLYRYEKAVWISTDLLMADKKLKKNYGGYIRYHAKDTTFVTMLDKKQKSKIAKYSFVDTEFEDPIEVNNEDSELSDLEKELLKAKSKLVEKLSDAKYEVTIPNGYNPNIILIKTDFGYRLYIIMGTSQKGIVPFGNDYLFESNSKIEITKWLKFHSRIIPAPPHIPGIGTVTSCSHSHLKSTPYVTATDICTFRLYAKYTDLKEFSVYSPAIGSYMKYNLESNKILIEE